MSKTRGIAAKPVFLAPSRVIWTEERLAALGKAELANLLANLQIQRGCGRVDEETAAQLEQQIRDRLPARAIALRRRRVRSEVQLEARAAEQLGALAAALASRYDLPADKPARSSGSGAAMRRRTLADSKGLARTGVSVKAGTAAIERYIGCRVGDSLACLAFVLLADRPQETGRYVLLGTEDMFDGEVAPNEFTPLAEQHGWSVGARARMRALPMSDYAEASQRFEALIARLATPPTH